MARTNFALSNSEFYCTKCGKKGLPVMRKKGQQREPGHLKKLYCIFCKEEVNHAEIRSIGGYTYEDFLEEFEAGRFVNGLKEKINDLPTCTCEHCPFNKDGRCWNSNHSNECGHRPIEMEV